MISKRLGNINLL